MNVPHVAHRSVGNAPGGRKRRHARILDALARYLKRKRATVAEALDAARRREGGEQ